MYCFKVLNLSIESNASDPSETVESLVGDIVVRFLRMGKFLTDQSKVTGFFLFKQATDILALVYLPYSNLDSDETRNEQSN